MRDPDPRRCFIGWHVSGLDSRESILANGFRPREERVYVAIHPHVPLYLGRKFRRHFVLFALELPLTGAGAWTIGVDCMLGLWECHLRRHVPREGIVDHLDSDESAAWPRFERGDGPARRVPIPAELPTIDGYAGWLPDPQAFLERCRHAVDEATTDGCAAVLGALHLVHGSACKPSAADIALMARVLPRVLVEDGRLDPTTLRAAADTLAHTAVQWLPLAMQLAPPRTIQRAALLSAFAQGAPKHDDATRTSFLRACGRGLDERHQRHLGVLHRLLGGQVVRSEDLADADAATLEALVQVVRQVPLGTEGGRRALDAVAAMPEPLADLGLLELLRHQRNVPSRARRYLVQLLRPRLARVHGALEEIAASADGRPQKHALWLLGRA